MTTDPPVEADQDSVQAAVDNYIESTDRVLFIKGTPQRPQCGFSQRAVGMLARYDADFEAVDVLDALPQYRAALEAHSGWETIPQLYVDGEFVGGSDIIVELAERGDLEATLAIE
jgi:monothiol glutaredoxin